MRRLTIAAIGALALSGCTGAHIKEPAVCDGKHRRPANIYGSVLPTLPVPVPGSQAGQSMVAPGPGPGPATFPAPPTPAPDAGITQSPPQTGAAKSRKAGRRTSQRDVVPSYRSC